MLIKICGITTLEAALAAERAGADFIGFVFAESKRQITVEQAQIIAAELTIPVVGVFVQECSQRINDIAAAVPLDYIQLHGGEDENFAKQLTNPIIKAFTKDEVLSPFPATFTLIDNVQAGAGKSYDYSKVQLQKNSFLAGGISLATVDQALACQPIGIDVSSGVETNGQKDNKKIQQFIAYVRSQTNV